MSSCFYLHLTLTNWTEEINWRRFTLKEVSLRATPTYYCVYQQERTFPERSHWEAVLNYWNKLKTNFILAWFCSKWRHASSFFDFAWSISGPLSSLLVLEQNSNQPIRFRGDVGAWSTCSSTKLFPLNVPGPTIHVELLTAFDLFTHPNTNTKS